MSRNDLQVGGPPVEEVGRCVNRSQHRIKYRHRLSPLWRCKQQHGWIRDNTSELLDPLCLGAVPVDGNGVHQGNEGLLHEWM